jgi:hypothetical protein
MNEKSKELLDALSMANIHRRWANLYERVIESHPDSTITCCECGYTILGDDPAITVVCLPCFEKKNGEDQ